jgi:hypothetical protein
MSQAILVPPEQREVLGQALADAVSYRDPPVNCRAVGRRTGCVTTAPPGWPVPAPTWPSAASWASTYRP